MPPSLPAKILPHTCQYIKPVVHGNAARDKRRGEMGISPWENRRKRLENLVPAMSHALGEQRSGSGPCCPARRAAGEEDDGDSSTAGLAA